KWLHHRSVDDFEAMTDISKQLRAYLMEHAEIAEPPVISEKVSKDGTIKWLLEARSGSAIETVFIPEGSRGTLCVSSQVGCVLDCTFCSTGKQGFNSNLVAGEIVGQVRMAERRLAGRIPGRDRAVTNVVLMGMGEPLLNMEAVLPAISIMMDDLGYGISKRKVTVSTAGVVPGIERLMTETDVSLAISLHAPVDDLRNQLVPLNRRYNIATLLDACKRYAQTLGEKRTVTIEYTLIDGMNDHADHAEALAKLLRDLPCKINLIPFNPFPGSRFRRPKSAKLRFFQNRLIEAGYTVMVRTTRGDDIDAACGQLAGAVEDRTKRNARYQRIWAAEGLIEPKEASAREDSAVEDTACSA
ncbi:MAG: 23S rRNA (adenine(2503)-C(2))-methyltransferase RlmN, partial [Gammaproteobacteria bacterium]